MDTIICTLAFGFILLCASSAVGRVCRGTSNGLSTEETPEQGRYEIIKKHYTGCTHVDGNLELVNFNNSRLDFSFLANITEISGYLLINLVYAERIQLTGLRIIRGRNLYENMWSVFVAINSHEKYRQNAIGLRELQLISLHDTQNGQLFIHMNKRLCYIRSVNWRDILLDRDVTYNDEHATDDSCTSNDCDPACEINGARHCWGKGPNMCQSLTRVTCSQQCDFRCSGPNPNDCCHKECAVGCTGPTNTECLACKNYDNNGSCVEFCPPLRKYSDKDFKQIPNPDAKYTYGSLCVPKCPDHLYVEGSYCVASCSDGHWPGPDLVCVKCEGPCPKDCEIPPDTAIDASIIRNLTGCTVIQGSIRILQHSLDGDMMKNVSALSVADLAVLETIQVVKGFVQIELYHPNFTSLSMLRNLEVIHGQQVIGRYSNSLQIFSTSLKSLDLDSLKSVRKGGIFIRDNPHLCYADTINFDELYLSDAVIQVSVLNNRNRTECEKSGEVCSTECSSRGCWGKRDDQCRSCARFQLDNRCLRSCNATRAVYQMGNNTCAHCDPECKNRCTNSTADTCDSCQHVRDGPYCVAMCPATKYADNQGVCQNCHENCGEAGCTGPRNSVGVDACNSCALAVFQSNNVDVKECLKPESDCGEGYFKQRIREVDSPMNGQHGCFPCHEMCKTCEGSGLSYCTRCRQHVQGGKCVMSCASDFYLSADGYTCDECHPHCRQCYGETASHCIHCKHYTIYADLSQKNPDGLSFNCTDKCPQHAPYSASHELEDSDEKRTVCIVEDLNAKLGAGQIGLITGLIAGVVVIVAAVVITVIACKRKQAEAKKKKVPTATLR